MKYKKGTFVIVPNLDELLGKPSEMQAIYLWICQHSNNDGICFPKKATICREAGCSHNTVDKYLKKLVDDGFLEITTRKNKEGKNTSNEYQLLIMGRTPTQNRDVSQPNNGSQTISNITIPNITIDIQPEVVVPVIEKKTLPLNRGNSPHQRVASIYNDLFKDKYGIYPPNAGIGSRLKVLKELCKDYTELQLSFLLIVFFAWKGMNDSNDKEQNYLQSKAHDLFTFRFNLAQYEVYTRNVAGYSKEFDDSDLLLPIVGKYILELSTGK